MIRTAVMEQARERAAAFHVTNVIVATNTGRSVLVAAADSGRLPMDQDCIAIATPSSYCDLPDAAVVLHPARSQDMFSMRFRVKDLLLCPTVDDVWFSDGEPP